MIINPYRYAAGGGGGSFSPDDVTGLVVWVDADAIAGLVDNDSVTSWSNDAPSSSETFTTGEGAPTYKTNVQNSLPAVRFDGGDSLYGTVVRNLKPFTSFVVMNSTLLSGARVMVGNNSGNGAINHRTNGANQNILSEATANIASASTTLSTSTTYLLDASYSSTGVYLFGHNGTDDGTGTNNVSMFAAAVTIGARDGDSENFVGDIFEMLVYDNVVSTSDRSDIRDHLKTKWGIS